MDLTSSSRRLTTASIEAGTCPPGKAETILWDAACPGLGVRVRATGGKSWIVGYRAGKGRAAPYRRITLGMVDKLGLADARRAARKLIGEIVLGADPAGKAAASRSEAQAAKASSIGAAVETYAADLEVRGVVKRSEVVSILRRELVEAFGDGRDLRTLSRKELLDRIKDLTQQRAGAGAYLRKASTGFLNWAANEGLIPLSPLAGYRKPRRTRAEMVDQPGQALSDEKLVKLWPATDSRFGTLFRVCLLAGTRRGEAAAMEWSDLDLEAGEWLIRAEVAKTGRGRVVYLAPLAVDLIRAVPRIGGVSLVFPSDAGTVITGWTKRVAAVVKASGVDFTMHDTRRTFRTGLSRLGVDRDTAELCLGHWRGDLVEAYDRDTAEKRQRAAVERWAGHVHSMVTGTGSKVVSLVRAAS